MNEFISLRDYFAAKALTALIIAHPNTAAETPDAITNMAYVYADKMLLLRKQQDDDLR